MEKVWFVHVEDHHRGPFDQQQIRVLLDTGRINSGHLLWREGMADWSALGNIADFGGQFQTRQLPQFSFGEQTARAQNLESALFNQTELDRVLTDLKGIDQENVMEIPPPLPQSTVDTLPKVADDASFQFIRRTGWGKRIFLTLINAGIVASVALALRQYYLQQGPFSRPGEMKESDYKRLKAMARTPLGQTEKFAFASTPGFSKFWAASNWPAEGTLYLSIKSIPGRVLSARPIEMTAQASYQNHLATFEHFNLLKGIQFFPGYYEVHLSNMAPDVAASVENSFKKISVQKKLLLGAEKETSFLPKLAEFNQKVSSDKKKYYSDLEQKNDTYLGLIADLETSYSRVVSKMKKGAQVEEFTDLYSHRFGPLITNMILDDEKISTRLYDQYESIADEYRDLARRGKQVGLTVTELITYTHKLPTLTTKSRARLKDKAKNNFGQLRATFQKNSNALKQIRMQL